MLTWQEERRTVMKMEAKKKTILIVENDERLMWTLKAALEDAGFNARATWSGHEALELLKAGTFAAGPG
jgi:DNA-binding NtrC family response regulator